MTTPIFWMRSCASSKEPNEHDGVSPEVKTVAVIGGGITGLATAHALTRSGASLRVVLFEASDRLGGKVLTADIEGVPVEAGADSFLDRDPSVRRLCDDVGLGAELEAPDVFGAQVYVAGALRPLPSPAVYGVPATFPALLRAQALGPGAKARALADLLSPRPLRGPDISVETFVSQRLGRAVVERLVDPMLAGTRAGVTSQLSLGAALPQIDAVARQNRSLIRGLSRALRIGDIDRGAPPFLAVRGGMSRLIERLRTRLSPNVELHTGAPVTGIISRGTPSYTVHVGTDEVEVDALVLAVPAFAAAPLLHGIVPEVSGELAAIRYASVASVALLYPSGDLRVPSGFSGMLVPSSARRTLAAATWFTHKWSWARGETDIVRAFVGRADRHPALDLDDAALIAEITEDLRALAGVSAKPRTSHVTRWDRGLPQYEVGHLDRVHRIERALASHPRIALAGAALRGSGIPDCVASATAAAERVLGALGEDRRTARS